MSDPVPEPELVALAARWAPPCDPETISIALARLGLRAPLAVAYLVDDSDVRSFRNVAGAISLSASLEAVVPPTRALHYRPCVGSGVRPGAWLMVQRPLFRALQIGADSTVSRSRRPQLPPCLRQLASPRSGHLGLGLLYRPRRLRGPRPTGCPR